MKLRRKLATAAVAVVAVGLLAGCGDQRKDLEGVPSKDPDKIEVYMNVDTHPNIVRVCIGGVAFATISRDYNSILRVPEWDTWCKG